jgi:hypothetical protein
VILGQGKPLVSRGSQVAEITVIPLTAIENGVVNGITAKKGVVCGENLVHTHLPVVFAQAVVVVENVGRQVTAGQNLAGWNGYVRRRNQRQERSRIGANSHCVGQCWVRRIGVARVRADVGTQRGSGGL